MTRQPLSAVVYVRDGRERPRSLRHAIKYCERMRYTVAGVVVDKTGSGWASAFAMLAVGEAQILVVGLREDLPPDRLPRIEVVAELSGWPDKARRPRRSHHSVTGEGTRRARRVA
jgi:hypothetical protein